MSTNSQNFDAASGTEVESNWLDRKLQRRQLTDSLNHRSMSTKAQDASNEARTFLAGMNRKAQLRTGIERKSEETRRQHEERLRRQADAYKQRLRKYLPEVLAD